MNAAPFACVDIGSNTTRLLVASWDGSQLRELMTQRVYTRLGKVIRKTGAMPPESVATETEVVATRVRHARDLGARDIRIVATAAIRQAPNRDELVRSLPPSEAARRTGRSVKAVWSRRKKLRVNPAGGGGGEG